MFDWPSKRGLVTLSRSRNKYIFIYLFIQVNMNISNKILNFYDYPAKSRDWAEHILGIAALWGYSHVTITFQLETKIFKNPIKWSKLYPCSRELFSFIDY